MKISDSLLEDVCHSYAVETKHCREHVCLFVCLHVCQLPGVCRMSRLFAYKFFRRRRICLFAEATGN